MADTELENPIGFVDKRKTANDPGNTAGLHVAASGTQARDYTSIAGLRLALATADAAYYTTARLNSMTKNDMIYARRLQIDAAGI